MQIVTDSGTDFNIAAENASQLNVTIVPLVVTLEGVSYREGVDIQPDEFYTLLAASENMPVTSQPSASDFADAYRRLAADDPDILSIHMSSGLSGTFNSAVAGAELVPEANVTHIDTKTLSAAAGWQVEAAALAVRAGWSLAEIRSLLKEIGDASESIYTLGELKYLIHGGRISHMKGLLASILNIKPIIGVEKVGGTYVQLGQMRTFKRALAGLVDRIGEEHTQGSSIRAQVLHSYNPEGAKLLRQLVEEKFECTCLASGPMSLVLGAHTGSSMVGVAYAAPEVFAKIPR